VEGRGLSPERIFLDPGIGFGKTLGQNLRLLRALQRLTGGRYPVFVGTSRKRFIGAVTGEPEAANRIMGTAATVAWSVFSGVAAVRVHDVRAMRQTVDMCRAILDPDGLSEDRLA
jgi:dihydropteroate synthase